MFERAIDKASFVYYGIFFAVLLGAVLVGSHELMESGTTFRIGLFCLVGFVFGAIFGAVVMIDMCIDEEQKTPHRKR